MNLEEIYDYLSFRLKRSDFSNFPVSNYRLKEVPYIWSKKMNYAMIESALFHSIDDSRNWNNFSVTSFYIGKV